MTEYSVLNPRNKDEGYGIKIITTSFVYDISRNLSAVSELCGKCNELQVDRVHFDCVLEDFLSRRDSF